MKKNLWQRAITSAFLVHTHSRLFHFHPQNRKLSSTAPTLVCWCKAWARAAGGGARDRTDMERAARTNRGPAVSVEVCLAGRAKEVWVTRTKINAKPSRRGERVVRLCWEHRDTQWPAGTHNQTVIQLNGRCSLLCFRPFYIPRDCCLSAFAQVALLAIVESSSLHTDIPSLAGIRRVPLKSV